MQVTWLEADLLEWRPQPASFDLVALVYLHLPEAERRAVYAAAAEAVAPGGRLVVIGHDLSNLTEGTGGPQDPERLFTVDQLRVGLDGFSTVRAERVIRDAGEGRQAIDAVLVADREP